MDFDDFDLDFQHPKCLLITISMGFILELYLLYSINNY